MIHCTKNPYYEKLRKTDQVLSRISTENRVKTWIEITSYSYQIGFFTIKKRLIFPNFSFAFNKKLGSLT